MNRRPSGDDETRRDPQSSRPLRVLHVEDSEDDAELVMHALRRAGYDLTYRRIDSRPAMETALAQQVWDVVLADYELPRFSGLAALLLLQNSGLDLPFLVVSGAIGEEVAVAAMKAGAQDYIMKGNLARLAPAIERELREAEVRRERRQAQEALREDARVSGALARVGQELISSLDTPVLLNRLCQVTTEVLECAWSHTVLWQPEEQVFVPVSGYGHTPEEWESIRVLTLPRSLLARLLARLEGEQVVDAAVRADRSLASVPMAYGITVALFMALRRGGEIVGIHIAAYRGRRDPFGPQQERIARGIAHLASLALANARLVEQLERANRLKSDFVATMSHELRTPLNIVVGYNDLLLDGEFGPLTAEQIDVLRRMDKSAHGLLELINATLDLSRLEAGRVPLEVKEIILSDLVSELDAEASELRDKPNVDFVWDVAPQLPPLHTDPVKLKVVLKNLIGNAVKFTAEGRVTVGVRSREGGVEFSVTDTGIGIAPETLPIIFEPFRQGESSMTRRFGGVGLGLHIARRLLDVLGGRITVDSEVGRGSTFRVWVPSVL
jgi:signal transduction histidine kinase/DNA-binding response OmpR family regulator